LLYNKRQCPVFVTCIFVLKPRKTLIHRCSHSHVENWTFYDAKNEATYVICPWLIFMQYVCLRSWQCWLELVTGESWNGKYPEGSSYTFIVVCGDSDENNGILLARVSLCVLCNIAGSLYVLCHLADVRLVVCSHACTQQTSIAFKPNVPL
jgi:hypothetical protein